MGVDVLQVFRLAAVDVARQVEIERVLRIGDLVERHPTGVTRLLDLLAEGIDDAVNIPLAQPILVAILDEALAGVDHENALARSGVFLVQHQDAGRDAGAVKQVGR